MLKLIAILIGTIYAKVSLRVHLMDSRTQQNWWKELRNDGRFDRTIEVDPEVEFMSASGYSSGGALTASLFHINSKLFDAIGTWAGTVPEQEGVEHCETEYQGKNIYVFQGTEDSVVNYKNGTAIAELFKKWGGYVNYNLIPDFEHIIPNALPRLNNYNNYRSCRIVDPPFTAPLNEQGNPERGGVHHNCGFNLARETLEHLFGGRDQLKDWNVKPQTAGEFYAFIQSPWNTAGAKLHEMAYIYIPDPCKQAGSKCKLHFHFHGCGQSSKYWRDILARKTGLMEYAATNNMIVVFPQNDDNTFGQSSWCWSSAHLKNKDDPQLAAVSKMIVDFANKDASLATPEKAECEMDERAMVTGIIGGALCIVLLILACILTALCMKKTRDDKVMQSPGYNQGAQTTYIN